MKLVKLGDNYFNPEKVVALVHIVPQTEEPYTNIFVGGGDNDYFKVMLPIDEVARKLEGKIESDYPAYTC